MKRLVLLVFLFTFTVVPFLRAQEIPKAGFRAEFLVQMDEVTDKLVKLAEATPEDKFSWRPAEGVRSISEVYVHIAGGNYFLLKFIGIEPPATFSRDMEKSVTSKGKVIEAVKQSIEHVRQAVLKTPDSDLDKPAEFFGQKTTVRGILLALANHMHEHLGQSIAYARLNGIVPPWSN